MIICFKSNPHYLICHKKSRLLFALLFKYDKRWLYILPCVSWFATQITTQIFTSRRFCPSIPKDLQQTSFACTVTCRHDFVAALQPTDIRSTENPHHWIMWQPLASTLSCHSNSYYITFFSVLQAFYMIFRQNKAKRIVIIIFLDIY